MTTRNLINLALKYKIKFLKYKVFYGIKLPMTKAAVNSKITENNL